MPVIGWRFRAETFSEHVDPFNLNLTFQKRLFRSILTPLSRKFYLLEVFMNL